MPQHTAKLVMIEKLSRRSTNGTAKHTANRLPNGRVIRSCKCSTCERAVIVLNEGFRSRSTSSHDD